MKKYLFFFSAYFLLVSSAFAQETLSIDDNISFYSTGYNRWYLNQGDVGVGSIIISGYEQQDNRVFSLKIPDDFSAIFTRVETALLNNAQQELSYSSDRKTLSFTSSASSISLDGVKVRVYDEDSTGQFLLDINQDAIYEARDTNIIDIDDNASRNESDTLKPEAIPQLQIGVEGNAVKITWEKPVDIDVRDIFVRKLKNGVSSELFLNQNNLEYLDTDISEGDNVEYTLYARDVYYLGEPTTLRLENVSFSVAEEETITETEENTSTVEGEQETSEQESIPDTQEETSSETEITRESLQKRAQEIMNLSKPLDRITVVREEMKQLSFKNKIWLMRYIIEERNK